MDHKGPDFALIVKILGGSNVPFHRPHVSTRRHQNEIDIEEAVWGREEPLAEVEAYPEREKPLVRDKDVELFAGDDALRMAIRIGVCIAFAVR